MEFELDIRHGINGHVEITDYSKEYDQYYSEEAEGGSAFNKFKYSQSSSINVITKITSENITLADVFLDNHTSDKETLMFDVTLDGHYIVLHFVLPSIQWVNSATDNILINYSVIYYTYNNKIYKKPVYSEKTKETYKCSLGNELEVSIRELLERNIEGTSILKCLVDIFYTGFLLECYINYCKELFNSLMSHCKPNCQPNNADSFPRDFLWMTLNVLDYLVERGLYNEALRILELIDYCGGFCNNINKNDKSMCGCHTSVLKPSCGCSQR